MMKTVCISNTPYSLFLFILLNKDKYKKSIYLYSKGISQNIMDHFDKTIYLSPPDSKYSPPLFKGILINIGFYIKLKIKLLFKGCIFYQTYGQDHVYGAEFFLRTSQKFYLLEDGLASYLQVEKIDDIKDGFFENFVKRILQSNMISRWGTSNYVDAIFLTGILPIPSKIAPKVTLINIREMWNKLKTRAQEEILNIFGIDILTQNTLENTKILLLTQCFSEEGAITEEEKIGIYSELISKEVQSDIVIKTHPREITDYSKYFPKAKIISKSFPIEILHFCMINIVRIYTINSSAIYQFDDNVEKIFYSGDWVQILVPKKNDQ